ncbi:alpha/beta fold hydrolase [Streptomyces umbrinus]|uniref:alpha/beta fold hydrolase n=1 Tax=Streptomyces umbrinus TaxID=67370 RepID=UPI003425A7AA
MATFVLLHGGAHQGRHWSLVRPLLETLGHGTIAPTLPMTDVNKGAGDWADVVVDAVSDCVNLDDLYLVGHSYSGVVLPLVASRVPVKRMIFLNAHVPVPGLPYTAYMEQHPECSIGPFDLYEYDEDGRLVLSWEIARTFFFPDCEEEVAKEAFASLQPCAMHVLSEPCPIDEWPDVPSTYIVGRDDALIGPDWGRAVSLERFGRAAVELPGDHAPFLARPQELVDVLHRIAFLGDSTPDPASAP